MTVSSNIPSIGDIRGKYEWYITADGNAAALASIGSQPSPFYARTNPDVTGGGPLLFSQSPGEMDSMYTRRQLTEDFLEALTIAIYNGRWYSEADLNVELNWYERRFTDDYRDGLFHAETKTEPDKSKRVHIRPPAVSELLDEALNWTTNNVESCE